MQSKQRRPTQLEDEIVSNSDVSNSEKEDREIREWAQRQQSLELALVESMKEFWNAATPDWPKKAKGFASRSQASRILKSGNSDSQNS